MKAITRYLYYFLLITLPYFSFLAAMTRLPFGLFANIFLLIIVAFTFIKGVNVREWLLFIFLSFFLLVIIVLKKLAFDIGLGEMNGSRYYLIVFLYYYITVWLIVNGELKLDFLFNNIVINSLLQALFGISHYIFFPTFNIYPLFLHGVDLDDFTIAGGMTRESGLLGNASVYANFLLLGLFLILNRMLVKKDHGVIKYLYCFILLFGIFLSRSRFPIFFALLALGLFCFKSISFKKFALIFIIIFVVMFGAVKYIFKGYEMKDILFFENRALKYKTAYSILKADIRYDIIGTPRKILQASEDPASVFSDNAYLEIALNCGIPFAIIYYILFFRIFLLSSNNFKSYFFIFYMLSLLFMTNCMGWNYWILYIFPVYFILVGEEAVKSGKFLIKPYKE